LSSRYADQTAHQYHYTTIAAQNINDNLPGLSSLWRSIHTTSFGPILPRNIRPFDQIAQAGNMMVGTCHNHRSRGRACSGSMKICKPQAILGELVDIWSTDFTAKAANVGEAKIVGYDD